MSTTHIHDAARADVAWAKSSYSGANSNCVECGTWGPVIAVRDSKSPSGPALVFKPTAWTGFLSVVSRGAFGD